MICFSRLEISDGGGLAALVEHLAGHDFEQIAAPEAFHRLSDQLGVFAGLVVAARRDAVGRFERFRLAVARQSFGRESVAGIVVAVVPGLGLVMVDDEDFVGQIEHEVALAFGALQRIVDRIELEGEVVAERAVEAEVGILVGAEQRGDGAQHREDRRDAAALLLGEDAARFGDGQREPLLGGLG